MLRIKTREREKTQRYSKIKEWGGEGGNSEEKEGKKGGWRWLLAFAYLQFLNFLLHLHKILRGHVLQHQTLKQL